MREAYELSGRSTGRDSRPAALIPLLSICLSELRIDVERLVASKWDDIPRRRAQKLLSTLVEACGQQRLDVLSKILRSMASLLSLSRAEALPLGRALYKKLDELRRLAERQVSEHSRRHIA
jgi:hypothetical protein